MKFADFPDRQEFGGLKKEGQKDKEIFRIGKKVESFLIE